MICRRILVSVSSPFPLSLVKMTFLYQKLRDLCRILVSVSSPFPVFSGASQWRVTGARRAVKCQQLWNE